MFWRAVKYAAVGHGGRSSSSQVEGGRRRGRQGGKEWQQQTVRRVPLGVVHFLITTISIWETNGTNSQSVRNLMRDHFLYKFLHFPCINSHLFALATLLTPKCQRKTITSHPLTQTLMMKGYIHFIGRWCQWLFKEFRSPLSWVKQLWQQERPLIGLVSFQLCFWLSPYFICFVLLVMGSGPRCHVCSS